MAIKSIQPHIYCLLFAVSYVNTESDSRQSEVSFAAPAEISVLANVLRAAGLCLNRFHDLFPPLVPFSLGPAASRCFVSFCFGNQICLFDCRNYSFMQARTSARRGHMQFRKWKHQPLGRSATADVCTSARAIDSRCSIRSRSIIDPGLADCRGQRHGARDCRENKCINEGILRKSLSFRIPPLTKINVHFSLLALANLFLSSMTAQHRRMTSSSSAESE